MCNGKSYWDKGASLKADDISSRLPTWPAPCAEDCCSKEKRVNNKVSSWTNGLLYRLTSWVVWPVQSHLPCSRELYAVQCSGVTISNSNTRYLYTSVLSIVSLKGQWSMSTEDAYNLHTDHSNSCSQMTFSAPHKWNAQWTRSGGVQLGKHVISVTE